MDKWSKQCVIIPYVFSKWASFPPQNESETENWDAIDKSVVLSWCALARGMMADD